METCYLSLGSNLGDRQKNLREAQALLTEKVGAIVGESTVYETEPWGYTDSQNYFNEVLCIRTSLSAQELLSTCLQIEKELGRKRITEGYEARTMDIDILFYGQQRVETNDLVIPHENLHKRRFVLQPLSEIAPELIHPVFELTVKQLLKQCEDGSWIQVVTS